MSEHLTSNELLKEHAEGLLANARFLRQAGYDARARQLENAAQAIIDAVRAIEVRAAAEPPALCAICDHIEELHTHPGVTGTHAFVPRAASVPQADDLPYAWTRESGGYFDFARADARPSGEGWIALYRRLQPPTTPQSPPVGREAQFRALLERAQPILLAAGLYTSSAVEAKTQLLTDIASALTKISE